MSDGRWQLLLHLQGHLNTPFFLFCSVLFLTLLAFYSLFCFNIFLVLIFFELLPTFFSLLKTAKQSTNKHKHTLIRKKKKKSLHIHLWQCGLEG